MTITTARPNSLQELLNELKAAKEICEVAEIPQEEHHALIVGMVEISTGINLILFRQQMLDKTSGK